jgi:hypothetical protein
MRGLISILLDVTISMPSCLVRDTFVGDLI